jgi:toxin ParE1/3/4
MNRYRLSRQAERDLEDIWFYQSEQNSISADQQIAEIPNRLPMLAQFPDMGTVRDELKSGARSFPSKPYLVFYAKLPDGIEILRFLHQSRDISVQLF